MVRGLMSNRTEAHRVADTRYAAKRETKRVSFNSEKDGELLEFANSLPDFSNFVKEKLTQEMNKPA